MDRLTTVLEEYLVKKAPSLPKNIKELIVKYAPILNIISIVISLPVLLPLVGLGALFSVFTGPKFLWTSVFLVISLVLRIIAISGLSARTEKGWTMIYYSVLVSALYFLLSFDLGSLIIGTGISLYLIFQVKEFYK